MTKKAEASCSQSRVATLHNFSTTLLNVAKQINFCISFSRVAISLASGQVYEVNLQTSCSRKGFHITTKQVLQYKVPEKEHEQTVTGIQPSALLFFFGLMFTHTLSQPAGGATLAERHANA